MKKLILFLAIFAIAIPASADKICAKKRIKSNATGSSSLVRAFRTTSEECRRREFELVDTDTLKGEKGDQGEQGPFPSSLPSGQTLVGHYSIGGYADAEGRTLTSVISFPYILAEAPSVQIFEIGEELTDECPGTANAPAAAPGFLCVYEATSRFTLLEETNRVAGSLAVRSFALPILPTNAATRTGATVSVRSIEVGNVVSRGSWAVTAP